MPASERSALGWVLSAAPAAAEPPAGAPPWCGVTRCPLPRRLMGETATGLQAAGLPNTLGITAGDERPFALFSASKKVSKWKLVVGVVQPTLSARSDCASVSVARLRVEPAACGAASSPCWLRKDKGRRFALCFVKEGGHARPGWCGSLLEASGWETAQPPKIPGRLANICSDSSTYEAGFGSVWSRTAWAGAAPAEL